MPLEGWVVFAEFAGKVRCGDGHDRSPDFVVAGGVCNAAPGIEHVGVFDLGRMQPRFGPRNYLYSGMVHSSEAPAKETAVSLADAS